MRSDEEDEAMWIERSELKVRTGAGDCVKSKRVMRFRTKEEEEGEVIMTDECWRGRVSGVAVARRGKVVVAPGTGGGVLGVEIGRGVTGKSVEADIGGYRYVKTCMGESIMAGVLTVKGTGEKGVGGRGVAPFRTSLRAPPRHLGDGARGGAARYGDQRLLGGRYN
ncbi:hypothetical protein E2C01_038404 [Portunus trituberculatus]|uniref:Uncharacterized protein n=1 Tax=Portunus trituberculatus TaxID=210409 RepID=A0A5B7FK29_PORTR|nr:hypothetical protein [Portunus trituberculatus]